MSILLLSALSFVSPAHAEPAPGLPNTWRTSVLVDAQWSSSYFLGDDDYGTVARQAKAGYDRFVAEGNVVHLEVWGSCDVHMPAKPEYNTAYCNYRSDAMADALSALGLKRGSEVKQVPNDEWAVEHDRRAYVRLVIDQPSGSFTIEAPETSCHLVSGPSLNWNGLQVGEEGVESTTVMWDCDGPAGQPTQVTLSLPANDGSFTIDGPLTRTLQPNVPMTVEVTYRGIDTIPRDVTLQATGPEGTVRVEGLARARVPPTGGYEPCKVGFGATIGANLSLQGVVGTLAIDGFIPVPLSRDRCNSVHVFAGGGLTPGRDEVSYLDDWQTVGVGTASTYFGGATYQWGEGLKTFEVGAWLQAVRIHWDGTPDLYQSGPRIAWTPRYKALQVEVWGSPDLMWGYAEGGSTGWSDEQNQPAGDNADRVQFTVAGGLGVGAHF